MIIPSNILLDMFVAPCLGAWIEIRQTLATQDNHAVAPCLGAWIEIGKEIEDLLDDFGRTLFRCVD